jgi:hypothetical protein
VVNLATRRFAIESTPETGAGFMLATLVGTLTAGVSGSQRESAGVSGSQWKSANERRATRNFEIWNPIIRGKTRPFARAHHQHNHYNAIEPGRATF